MNPAVLELALRKQRLQIDGERLRDELARHAGGIRPAFAGVDAATDALRWLRAHPQVTVAVGTALVVSRPKRAWRWIKRAFFGWQAWRKLRDFLDTPAPAR